MSEDVLQKIREILFPKIGGIATESTIRVNCQRLGIKPEELTREKLNVFAEDIKLSLLLFLEDKEVEEVIKKIKSI